MTTSAPKTPSRDAFISIWASRASYHAERGSVAAWAMSVVRNRAIYLAQHQPPAGRQDDAGARLNEQPAHDDVPNDFATRAEHQQLTEHLALLPPAQQEVIRLGFFDGLTHQEIARQLALPQGTVKGRMRLGLNRLRSDLDR